MPQTARFLKNAPKTGGWADRATWPVSGVVRVATSHPISLMQRIVVELIGLNYTAREIADALEIKISTVKWHAGRAADRIPGDLPVWMKCAAWARGATLDVLEGTSLCVDVQRRAHTFRLAERATARAFGYHRNRVGKCPPPFQR